MADEFGNFTVQVCRTYSRTTNKNCRKFIAHNGEEQVKHLHPAQQTCAAKNMSKRVIDNEVVRLESLEGMREERFSSTRTYKPVDE